MITDQDVKGLSGPDAKARANGDPDGSLTGTTNDMHDAWFIGYTPELATGVWIGYDSARNLGKNETGGRTAAPVFLDYMKGALTQRPTQEFSVPEGVVFARVDRGTGLLAPPGDESAIFMPFRDATFDQVVSIHALYVHPAPDRLLREAYRVLKPGGHAVFVNHTRQIGRWSTVRELARRDGLGAALHGLLWVLPNSIFEAVRRRIGPHYWDEDTFSTQVRRSGFSILAMRRTFLGDASLLVWARKNGEKEFWCQMW
jgi:SAM-dependent methyltransferase